MGPTFLSTGTAEMRHHPTTLSTSAPIASSSSSLFGSPGRPPTPTQEESSHQHLQAHNTQQREPLHAADRHLVAANRSRDAGLATTSTATGHVTTATRERAQSRPSPISTPASTINTEAPWRAVWDDITPMTKTPSSPIPGQALCDPRKRRQHRPVLSGNCDELYEDGFYDKDDDPLANAWAKLPNAPMQGSSSSSDSSANMQSTGSSVTCASFTPAAQQESRTRTRTRADGLWTDMEAAAREVVLGSFAEGLPSAQAAAALTPLECDPLCPYGDIPVPCSRDMESPVPSSAFVASDDVPPAALASLVSWLGQGVTDTSPSKDGPSSAKPTSAMNTGSARGWLPSFPTLSSGCPNPPEALQKEPRFDSSWRHSRVDMQDGGRLADERQNTTTTTTACTTSTTPPPLIPLNPLPARQHTDRRSKGARRKMGRDSGEAASNRKRSKKGQRKRRTSGHPPLSSSSLLRTSAESSSCSSGAPSSPTVAAADEYRRIFPSRRRVNPKRTSDVRARSSARTQAAEDEHAVADDGPLCKAAKLRPCARGLHFDDTPTDSTDSDNNNDADEDDIYGDGTEGSGGDAKASVGDHWAGTLEDDSNDDGSDNEWLPSSQWRRTAGNNVSQHKQAPRSNAKRCAAAKSKNRKSKVAKRRRRRKPISRTNKPGSRPTSASQPVCPICKGIGRNSSKRICGICYSGLYNDVSKLVRAKLNFPLTDNEPANRRELKKVLKELPRGCKKGYKCTDAAWKYSIAPSAKCTRCRSIHIIDTLPELADLTMNTLL